MGSAGTVASLALLRRVRALCVPLKYAAFSSLCLVGTGLCAESPKPSEYQVKAAYIYNFGKFVKWPTNTAASQDGWFTICILGDDPISASLQSSLAGQSIGGKPVAVKRLARPRDALGCLVLFITTAEESHLKDALTLWATRPC
jgi:hypothetical protein